MNLQRTKNQLNELHFAPPLMAQSIVKQDYQIDSTDAGIRLFVRMKMQEGNSRFDNGNVVVFDFQHLDQFFRETALPVPTKKQAGG